MEQQTYKLQIPENYSIWGTLYLRSVWEIPDVVLLRSPFVQTRFRDTCMNAHTGTNSAILYMLLRSDLAVFNGTE